MLKCSYEPMGAVASVACLGARGLLSTPGSGRAGVAVAPDEAEAEAEAELMPWTCRMWLRMLSERVKRRRHTGHGTASPETPCADTRCASSERRAGNARPHTLHTSPRPHDDEAPEAEKAEDGSQLLPPDTCTGSTREGERPISLSFMSSFL